MECEVNGMRISASKSEAIVLIRKPVDCPLRVENYSKWVLGFLFMSRGTTEWETGWRIGATGAVFLLHSTSMNKKEESQRVKLSIYQSVFVPTCTYGHDLSSETNE